MNPRQRRALRGTDVAALLAYGMLVWAVILILRMVGIL